MKPAFVLWHRALAVWRGRRRWACALGALLHPAAAAWCHDTGSLHIHAPDLGSFRSPTGMFVAGVIAVLMFGFFGGCAVMLLLDLIRDWRERRERRRREAREAQTKSADP